MIAPLWAEAPRQNQESPSRWLSRQSIHLQCRRLPAIQEPQVWSLGREVPLEKEMAPHSSILAWKIPWTEEPGGPQTVSMTVTKINHMNHKNKWLSPNPTLYPLLCSHFSLENFESGCKHKVPAQRKMSTAHPCTTLPRAMGSSLLPTQVVKWTLQCVKCLLDSLSWTN